MIKIFVYGSLREGEYNHVFLENEKYLHPGLTKRHYTFYDLGGFPAMVKGGTHAVVGEIYEVSPETLERLDILESHPQFYERQEIVLQGGMIVQAYILNESHTQGRTIIRSGDWKKRH